MENVKLTYFKDNGRVGLIRAMLSYKKIPFENIMYTKEEWPPKKDNYEFRQLPQLEVNGKKLTQTIAISLYLARQLDLYPKDIYLQYHVDSLLAIRDDLTPLYRKVKYKQNTEEEAQKYKEMVILYLQRIEARYKELGNGNYYLGNDLSVADFFIGCMVKEFADFTKDVNIMEKSSPEINKLVERLKKNELKEFYEKYYISFN